MSVKLLTNLDFAKVINSNEAITEAGKEILKNYRSYVYTKPVTCGIVNGFVQDRSSASIKYLPNFDGTGIIK